MPELPEVETMVRGIRPGVEGGKLVAVRACPCAYKPLTVSPSLRKIQGRTRNERVISVRRKAKRAILELSSGDCFVVEPRMTGLLLLSDPPDREHLRFEWRISQKGEEKSLRFWDRRGLGTIRLYTPEEFGRELGPNRLGADALSMNEEDWRERCAGTGRSIKVALLDQKFVAGIGNLYANEILHEARIHPEVPADKLSRSEIQRVRSAVISILNEAIRYEGSTLNDGTYRNALNQNGSYQNCHRVYAREGEQCVSCERGKIRRKVQAQRSTFSCPVCQRRKRGRSQKRG